VLFDEIAFPKVLYKQLGNNMEIVFILMENMFHQLEYRIDFMQRKFILVD
jgi:hypothetical protein